jgi:crotonobetainyl-CoA:carnitine CoA-transferase CaiB-like acyl-CoA transferase
LGEHNLDVHNLEQHSDRIKSRNKNPKAADKSQPELPLKGIRVLDATAWWAGPSATQMLAHLGAEIIHLEAIQRMDGMRMTGGMFYHLDKWWERSAMYLSANSNKRGLTLDLDNPRGVEIAKRLIAKCDVFVENFSPRVVEKFGLDWPQVQALNPQTIMVRMPAFGLSGPWRDNVGFAQTMEQITGMAWLTGHKEDQPRIQRGPCDPLAGMHAAFATLVALADRQQSGKGQLVECSMVEGALNAAAEQIVEYSAYGNILQRDGNRSAMAVPQGLYACTKDDNAKKENWLALSIATDQQWQALKQYLGSPAWAADPNLDSLVGRRAKQDFIDAALSRFFADKNSASTVESLIAVGVPAGLCRYGAETSLHPQLIARNFYEKLEHPIVGMQPFASVPFRFKSHDRNHTGWLRNPAPILGEHNTQILTEILALSAAEIADLESDGVIGSMPKGV